MGDHPRGRRLHVADHLCSIAAVAIILERLWTLQSNRVIPRDLAQKVWNWIEADQMSDKLVVALEQNSPLGKLLAIGLANRDKPREIMVERLEDGGRHVIHDLGAVSQFARHDRGGRAAAGPVGNRRRHHPCVQCHHCQRTRGSAELCPAESAKPSSRPPPGLTVAIPSLIAYRFLRSKVERLVIRMEKEAMKLVDALDERGGFAER